MKSQDTGRKKAHYQESTEKGKRELLEIESLIKSIKFKI